MVKLFDFFNGPGGEGSSKDRSRLIEEKSEPKLRRRWTFKGKLESGKQEVNDKVREVITRRTFSVNQYDKSKPFNENEKENEDVNTESSIYTTSNNETENKFDLKNVRKVIQSAQNVGRTIDSKMIEFDWDLDARTRLFSRGASDKEKLIGKRTGSFNETDQTEAKPTRNQEIIERKLSDVRHAMDFKAREFGRTVENKARLIIQTDEDKDHLIDDQFYEDLEKVENRARLSRGRDAMVGALSDVKRNTTDKVRNLLNSKTKGGERMEKDCLNMPGSFDDSELSARVVDVILVDNTADTAEKKKNLDKKAPVRLWRTVRTSWKSLRRNYKGTLHFS